jgi:hypothetical protein
MRKCHSTIQAKKIAKYGLDPIYEDGCPKTHFPFPLTGCKCTCYKAIRLLAQMFRESLAATVGMAVLLSEL